MKALIIDDEIASRENCKILLEQLHPQVQVCGEADNVESAYEAILLHQPDLVLLDIDLPDGNAFDLLRKFPKINFSIVFITAHEQFAIQAIKFSALDYLLKPFTSGEFSDAIHKALVKRQQEMLQTGFTTLLQNMQARSEPARIVLRTVDAMHVVPVNNIIRLEADGSYTRFYMKDRNSILVSGHLKEYENLLGNNGFFRSHQSHLINSSHVVCLHKADGGSICMSDQSKVPVASRYREKVIRQLEQF